MTTNIKLIRRILYLTILLVVSVFAHAETIYVNSDSGDDANIGTQDKPLQTIARAAQIVNDSNESEPTTIKIAPGVYVIDETVTFENQRSYTRDARLTIEATILPDDPNWKPVLMPVILSTEIPQKWQKTDAQVETSGLKVEISHVTIRGIKFLGNPVSHIWYYPIFREGKQLEDLIVTQCLFAMDSYAVSSNVAIIANGHGLVVDHCIFYRCRNPVVFWNATGGISKNNAMRYCIVDGAYTSSIWICQTAEDLEFHHNIITRSECVWMRNSSNQTKYRLHDCIMTDNKCYSMECGPDWKLSPTGSGIIYEENDITKTGKVVLEMGNGIDVTVPKNFLHPVDGTLGSELGAGLFTEPVRTVKTEEYGYRKETYTYKEVDGQEILADVFLPAKDEARAVVLYIHGGGFMFGSRIGRPRKPLLDKLIEANYAVVSIDYRLAPEIKLEEIVKDARDACIWIRRQGPSLFNADPNKLGVIGGSAGAFLATVCGYTVKPRPQTVVAISGFADFDFAKPSTDRSILKQSNLYDSVGKKILTQGGEDRYKLCFFLLENGLWPWEILGFEPTSNRERINALLPMYHINSDYPATLLIHSKNDQNVPFSQAEKLSQTLTAQKIESELFIVPQGHSSEIIRNDPEAVAKIVSFLDKYLKKP